MRSSGSAAGAGITDETWDDLEEALLLADVGVGVTTDLLDGLRTRVKDKELTEPDELIEALRDGDEGRSSPAPIAACTSSRGDGPNVWLFVGVNGVGKTTTIGKVASVQQAPGIACCWPPVTRSAPPRPSS